MKWGAPPAPGGDANVQRGVRFMKRGAPLGSRGAPLWFRGDGFTKWGAPHFKRGAPLGKVRTPLWIFASPPEPRGAPPAARGDRFGPRGAPPTRRRKTFEPGRAPHFGKDDRLGKSGSPPEAVAGSWAKAGCGIRGGGSAPRWCGPEEIPKPKPFMPVMPIPGKIPAKPKTEHHTSKEIHQSFFALRKKAGAEITGGGRTRGAALAGQRLGPGAKSRA